MRYLVTCRCAAGTDVDVRVTARNGAQACRQALRQLETSDPGRGWMAVRELEL